MVCEREPLVPEGLVALRFSFLNVDLQQQQMKKTAASNRLKMAMVASVTRTSESQLLECLQTWSSQTELMNFLKP